MLKPDTVPENVRGRRGVRVVSVEPAGFADVYNLEVDETHSFAVAGGIIVHNCGDGTRYRVMHVRPTITVRKLTGF